MEIYAYMATYNSHELILTKPAQQRNIVWVFDIYLRASHHIHHDHDHNH